MGLWLVQECRRRLARARARRSDYADLAELARRRLAGGRLFDPRHAARCSPRRHAGTDPRPLRRTRPRRFPPVDRAALTRAVFESLACKYRLVLEELEQATGETIESST